VDSRAERVGGTRDEHVAIGVAEAHGPTGPLDIHLREGRPRDPVLLPVSSLSGTSPVPHRSRLDVRSHILGKREELDVFRLRG